MFPSFFETIENSFCSVSQSYIFYLISFHFKEQRKEGGITTPKDDEVRKAQMRQIIEDFLKATDQSVLHCSAELNTYERMLMHELAEEAGLSHMSQGEAKERHIVLTKKKNLPKTLSQAKEDHQQPSASSKTVGEKLVVCSTCSKEIPKANIELHKLRCMVALKPATAKDQKMKKKDRQKGRNQVEEDVDKLIASFDKIDNVCNLKGCKAKIATLGVRCDHCALRFCIKDGLPEAHGCGEAARQAARKQIASDGKLFAGSGRPDFKPDPVKKAQLQRKIDKKLDEMQAGRSRKKPAGKKK